MCGFRATQAQPVLRRTADGMTLGMRQAIRSGFEPGEEGWGQVVGGSAGRWWRPCSEEGWWDQDGTGQWEGDGVGGVIAGGREGSDAPGVFKDRSLDSGGWPYVKASRGIFWAAQGWGGITERGTPWGWKLEEFCWCFQLLIHSSPALFCVLL